MDFISILATVILFVTLATLVVALAAYGAYKLRERARVKAKDEAARAQGPLEAIFLDRYQPGAARPRQEA